MVYRNNITRGRKKTSILMGVLIAVAFILILFSATKNTYAAMPLQFSGNGDEFNSFTLDQLNNLDLNSIKTSDKTTQQKISTADTRAASAWTKEWLIGKLTWLWEKGGSEAFNAALSASLKKIAYDTATWLGSGGKGQKPTFITEGWGEYLTNITDEAAGQFIEELGKKGPVKFNLCNPDFSVTARIGLGLMQSARPTKPACTFSQLKENWEKELSSPDFMTKFQDMFNPASNDIGIALSLQTGMFENEQAKLNYGAKKREEGQGWLDINSLISDKRESPPKYSEFKLQQSLDLQSQNLAKFTGNAFVDAANVFLNQLAITLFQKMLAEIGKDKGTYTGPYDWSNLTDYFSGYSKGGIVKTKEYLKKIVQPNFNVRGDYNILSELTSCPDSTKAGPTNCVVEEKFRQAVHNRQTVGDAIESGYLNPNATFGFDSNGLEPSYTEGYPYRSMIILRKFRLLPVGWELAAQYIKNNLNRIGGAKNLSDLVACFDPLDDYKGYSAAWCQGLVDPNWVLKAPLNYCRREGPGPEIVNSKVSGEGKESELAITRNDEYCGDEQSCIKENSDGSCQIYGYCTEERRKWRFDGKACEARDNSCETFKATDGNSVSYLKDTLDFSNCSVDNAGCLGYCVDYNYLAGNYTCTAASVGDKIYLDRDAEQCQPTAEGCHEFVRTKNGLGANLAPNSGFETDLSFGGWSVLGATSSTAYEGRIGLLLNSGPLPDLPVTVGPSDFDIGNDAYTLSFYSNGCASTSSFALVGGPIANFRAESGWQFNQLTYIVPAGVLGRQVGLRFNISGAGCVIDALKLERGYRATAYTSQTTNQRVYEKLLPDYYGGLGGVCYDAAGNLKSDAPSECSTFARTCSKAEVGCELFTAKEDKMSIPAIVGSNNYCVAECAGFKAYLQTETYFDSLKQQNLIAKSAESCSAQVVGCDEFTNLDAAAAGGEAKEYYSYLRQCVKPGASCGEFYTWEGSNETGFQLRVMTLDAVPNLSDGRPDPRVTDPAVDASLCNETIYNLPPTDPAYNPDCREFYNTSGDKRYHLYTYTVSCSDDCHPYRRTEINIDPSISLGSCVGSDKDWGDHNGDTVSECAYCKNGGVWSSEHSACLYQAVPSEGRSCQAAAAGCREYTGSTGRNVRVALNHDFEDGTRQGWGATAGTLNLSNESLVVGGRSLALSGAGGPGSIYVSAAGLVSANKSYVLSFIAKAASGGASSLSARLQNSAASSSDFGAATGVIGDWRFFEVNLASLNHQVDSGEQLIINSLGGNGDFFIDNIKLTEITDRYYLIINSWNTPAVCHADLAGNPVPNYMLGCEEYGDRDKQIHYLKSFAALCSESAVGCEVLTDTQNSTNADAESFNVGTPAGDEWTVPADDYIYAVYDKAKQCKAADKGCERVGSPYNYDGTALYQDVYIKNDPDSYYKSMCTLDASFCQEYTTADGLSYFKDPGDQVCEWRQAYQGSEGWYRKKIKRCNATGGICLKDSDCGGGQTCQTEAGDTSCDTEATIGQPPKTIGIGGSVIAQPANRWVGLCAAQFAGCTELIDPVSQFSINLIFNPDFSQNIDTIDEPTRDGWDGNDQQVKIEPNTLYRLAGSDSAANNLSISFNGVVYLLDESINQLVYAGMSLSIPLESDTKSILFFSGVNSTGTVAVSAVNVGVTKVELKRAAVDYQLESNLDKASCNGLVNFNDGCVLFNQRNQSGSSSSSMLYDADLGGTTPTVGSPSSKNDSNILLKVSPDRVCDKWLACRSKISYLNNDGQIENYCSDIGVCNSLDNNGNCDNFLTLIKENQTFVPATIGRAGNLVGYSKVGFDWGDGTVVTGNYHFGTMKQTGEVTYIPNGNFEYSDPRGYPITWKSESAKWTTNVFKAIDNPFDTQRECLNNNCDTDVPDGRAFLRLGAGFSASSESVDVIGGLQYIATAYINTVNLSDGQAQMTVEQRNSSGNVITSNLITLEPGKGWEQKLLRITMGSNTSKIKVILSVTASSGTATSTGRAYFDSLTFAPALESYDQTPGNPLDANFWYTPQSCRLYPDDNSLSCSYIDNSGVMQLGWPGYCLEYDRAPGSQNACLLWWPVDRVKGDGVWEGAGYQGRYPIYYCTESERIRFFEYRHAYYRRRAGCGDGHPPCPTGYFVMTSGNCHSCTFGGNENDEYCIPAAGIGQPGYTGPPIQLDGSTSNIAWGGACGLGGSVRHENDGWYEYTGSLEAFNITLDNNNPRVNYLCNGAASCNLAGELIRSEFSPTFFTTADGLKGMMGISASSTLVGNDRPLYCTELVQTVSQAGQNKYWGGHVYEGSNYQEACYVGGDQALGTTTCLYSADYKPFGSIVYPEPGSDPAQWDAKGYTGIQPLFYELPDTGKDAPYQPRMGQLHNSSELQRLFAKSYGAWRWATSSSYQSVEGWYVDAAGTVPEWDVPASLCNGTGSGPRPTTRPADYCAILPAISNVKVDAGTANVTITKNGFVNLTFNSTLDSQQRPLVLYAVDWGDDEYTTATGIEMNDRPYLDKPHSLYHLYSYWDLKGKAGSGVTSIDCSMPHECRITPRVKIKDNWGWCNAGVDDVSGTTQNPTGIDDCNQWVWYGAQIVVKEN